MADIKTMKKHLSEIFKMKESFDVFLKDTEASNDGKRCYAIYQFIHQLVLNTDYDVEVTDFDTSGHTIFIKTLINDGRFAVCVETIRNPAKHEISDRIHIVVYKLPSGHHIANFSFNTGKFNAYGGMPFETSIGLTNNATTDEERHQVFSDVSFAITKTIEWYVSNWYVSTGVVSVEDNQ